MNRKRSKYILDSETGEPAYLSMPYPPHEDVVVISCITEREAARLMDERIVRVCLEIQDSWTLEERKRRWAGKPRVEWDTPIVEVIQTNGKEDDG